MQRLLDWLGRGMFVVALLAPFVWPTPGAVLVATFVAWGVGVAGLVLWRRKARALKKTDASHGEPAALSSCKLDSHVTVRGQVVGDPTAESPATGNLRTALVAVAYQRTGQFEERPLLKEVIGRAFTLETDDGKARVKWGVLRLFGSKRAELQWHGWGLDAVPNRGVRSWLAANDVRLEQTDRDRDRELSPKFHYHEICIDPDDDVLATGRVTSVEERSAPAGYRGSAVERSIEISPDAEGVTSVLARSKRELVADRRSAKITLGVGVTGLLWGAAAIAYVAWRAS